MHYGKIKKSIYWIYEKLTNRIDARTIYVSHSEKISAIRFGSLNKKAATVINNGVAVSVQNQISDQFNQIRSLGNADPDNFLVISLSRFDYAKNSVEVLRLAQQFPDVKFWIIGDGPDRNLLLQKKKRLGLQNLWLPGFREDITEILSVANLYLSTSRWEGLPLAVLEAMSVSIPTLATDVDGNRDVVKHGVSGFVPVRKHPRSRKILK